MRGCAASVLCLALGPAAHGQCGPIISTFPYGEGFEAAPAWTSGGTGNDWAWGTPAHIVINSAGGGAKSWCVGGLTGAFYTNNERSWLESPCFDFSALERPRISFKIFWEVERQYDGMTFQYSTDGGATYNNVGSYSDPADCNTAHWFNSANLTNLPNSISPKHGWSGRIGPTMGNCLGGGGSGQWVTAKHCLGWLAHAPSVRFRFFFGAGSACNNYDGIAIDDILIEESDPVTAAFTGDCNGNTVDFINASTPCPHLFSWDFGEPGQPGNTSQQESPSHTYAGPGTYTVTLTATDACGATATSTQQISILGVSINAVQPSCGQDNGSLEAVVTGANGPVNFAWSPGGATTPDLSGLGGGDYTVTVSAANSCPATATATLVPSTGDFSLNLSHTDVTCAGSADGTATAQVVGGQAPVSLSWQPGGGTTATITGLVPGDYTCTATDGQGCTTAASVAIAEPAAVTVQAMADTAVCEGTTITLHAMGAGGTGGYTYAWTPQGPEVTPGSTTTYTVMATDAAGCTSPPAAVTVAVSQAFVPSFTVSDTVGCTPLCATFQAQPANAAAYQWDFGDGQTGDGASPQHCFATGGTFDVRVTVIDGAGCSGSLTLPGLVHALASPQVAFNASPPVATIDEPTFHFSNGTSHADQYTWHFGDEASSSSTDLSPSFTYGAVGCYTVTLDASNADGCTGSGSAEACVEDAYQLFMPNAFTPDGDNINDVVRPITSVRNPKDFRLTIFDRWGSPVFTTTDPHQGWDGSGLPDGLYVWKLWITDAVSESHEQVGHVVLMR